MSLSNAKVVRWAQQRGEVSPQMLEAANMGRRVHDLRTLGLECSRLWGERDYKGILELAKKVKLSAETLIEFSEKKLRERQ